MSTIFSLTGSGGQCVRQESLDCRGNEDDVEGDDRRSNLSIQDQFGSAGCGAGGGCCQPSGLAVRRVGQRGAVERWRS